MWSRIKKVEETASNILKFYFDHKAFMHSLLNISSEQFIVNKELLPNLSRKKFNVNIFISHAWKDKELAVFKNLENCLQRKYYVWTDVRKIEFGESIDEKIKEAVENTDVFLLLWSKAAHQSKYVQKEVKAAYEHNKKIILCVITDYNATNFSEMLSTTDYTTTNFQEAQERSIKYFDFSKDDDFALLELKQYLIRLQITNFKFTSFINQGTNLENLICELNDLICELNDLICELNDLVYRKEQGFSGNEHGHAYIKSALESSIQLLQLFIILTQGSGKNTKSKQKLIHFFEIVESISFHYPNPEQDSKKISLLVKAIDAVDPEGTEETMQNLKYCCLRILKERQN